MAVRVGTGNYVYEVVEGWGQLPDGWELIDVAGVRTDSDDNVYVFNRGTHPIVVFDRAGRVVRAFGDEHFARGKPGGPLRLIHPGPHGLCIGPDDAIYLVDVVEHTVKKFTRDGALVLTLGTPNQPSDTGIDWSLPWHDANGGPHREVKRAAGPFNGPVNAALSPVGEIYVTDGYGNARVHKFDRDGELLFSFAGPGDGPGQLFVPHGVGVDRAGRVYVSDRQNSRVQLFSPEGTYLCEWPRVHRPTDLFLDRDDRVFLCEFGYKAGPQPGQLEPPGEPKPEARVTVRDLDGAILSSFGEGPDNCAPGCFFAPHGICVDSRGDVYVGEVVHSAGERAHLFPGQEISGRIVPNDCHALQKLVRVA